jgi:hypothetical protein
MEKTNMEIKTMPKPLLQNFHASLFHGIAMYNRKLVSSYTLLAARVQDGHVMKRYSIQKASCVFAAST